MVMFDKAKVGDKVWGIGYGWGVINSLYNDRYGSCCSKIISGKKFPLDVHFKNGRSASFTFEGKIEIHHTQPTLFWDEVKIVPPEEPKRCRDCNRTLLKGNSAGNCCADCYFKRPKEIHRHNFCEPVLNSRAEVFAYECRCGDRVAEGRPKAKCEACNWITATPWHEGLIYLFNQHHTCDAFKKKGFPNV
jgi:hypothetical protein